MRSSLLDSTVTDGNAATDHGVLDVIENTSEKNFFSGGLAGDAWDVSRHKRPAMVASGLKCVGETGSKVMNCDELSPFLRPWQAISLPHLGRRLSGLYSISFQ